MHPTLKLHFCYIVVIVLSTATGYTKAFCEFPKNWHGRWFQSGVQHEVQINSTHIDTKGQCEAESGDKYLLYYKPEDCYRCLAIHVIHSSVLQFKETFCERGVKSIEALCYGITGDATLYSMFRKTPEVKPIPCPFKNAPFSFTYNKGFGECSNPPSKAEMCTDDSRMVLKYQACPDVPSTESSVEELVCLTTWKEGSTKYLVGKVLQPSRRVNSDEDEYRCFIYQRNNVNGQMVYHVAQSGDATCNGLSSVLEGSKTVRLTPTENHHNKCKFPSWITDHHTWWSLDHKKTFKFSTKNATLKIVDDKPKPTKPQFQYSFETFGLKAQDQRKQNSDMRLVCYSILDNLENKRVQIVAHITAGCDSGYMCLNFYKRDSHVIELQQSEKFEETPDEACRDFDPTIAPYTTLITANLPSKKCPEGGKYIITRNGLPIETTETRKKRQQPGHEVITRANIPECTPKEYESLSIGCTGSHELMEFKTGCLHNQVVSYSCHGHWMDNNTHYVITTPNSRKSTDPLRYCFIYTIQNRSTEPPVMRLSGVSQSCHRDIVPGLGGSWTANLTSNGTCAEIDTSNVGSMLTSTSVLAVVAISTALLLILR